jgi:hypothetical protein
MHRSSAFSVANGRNKNHLEADPAAVRQQMGNSSAEMTALHTGKIPLERVRPAFSPKIRREIVIVEKMENGAAA